MCHHIAFLLLDSGDRSFPFWEKRRSDWNDESERVGRAKQIENDSVGTFLWNFLQCFQCGSKKGKKTHRKKSFIGGCTSSTVKWIGVCPFRPFPHNLNAVPTFEVLLGSIGWFECIFPSLRPEHLTLLSHNAVTALKVHYMFLWKELVFGGWKQCENAFFHGRERLEFTQKNLLKPNVKCRCIHFNYYSSRTMQVRHFSEHDWPAAEDGTWQKSERALEKCWVEVKPASSEDKNMLHCIDGEGLGCKWHFAP